MSTATPLTLDAEHGAAPPRRRGPRARCSAPSADPLEVAGQALRSARRRAAAGPRPRGLPEVLRTAETALLRAAAEREADARQSMTAALGAPWALERLRLQADRAGTLAARVAALRGELHGLPRPVLVERLDTLGAEVASLRERDAELLFEAWWTDLGAGD